VAFKSVGVRLEGTEEQLGEALKRLKLVADVSEPKLYESRRSSEALLLYCRLYFHADRPSLADQYWASQRQIQEMQELLGESSFEIERLREALNLAPKPRPFDVVLGGKS